MQTIAFTETLRATLTRLQATPLINFFQAVFAAEGNSVPAPETKDALTKLLFEFSAAYAHLGTTQRELVDRFGLGRYATPLAANRLVETIRRAEYVWKIKGDADILQFAAMLSAVDATLATMAKYVTATKFGAPEPGITLLALDVMDYDEHGVLASRLATAVEAFSRLYETTAGYLGFDPTPLRIAYTDSGSDLSIGFKGVDEVIRAITDMFGRAWTAVRFRTNERFERNLESALRGMTFLDEVRRRADAGAIDGDTARKLDAIAKQQIQTLLGAGAAPRELPSATIPDNRSLLSAVQDVRRLGPGSNDT